MLKTVALQGEGTMEPGTKNIAYVPEGKYWIVKQIYIAGAIGVHDAFKFEQTSKFPDGSTATPFNDWSVTYTGAGFKDKSLNTQQPSRLLSGEIMLGEGGAVSLVDGAPDTAVTVTYFELDK